MGEGDSFLSLNKNLTQLHFVPAVWRFSTKVHKQTTHVVATILLLVNVSLAMDMFYSGMETAKNLVL